MVGGKFLHCSRSETICCAAVNMLVIYFYLSRQNAHILCLKKGRKRRWARSHTSNTGAKRRSGRMTSRANIIFCRIIVWMWRRWGGCCLIRKKRCAGVWRKDWECLQNGCAPFSRSAWLSMISGSLPGRFRACSRTCPLYWFQPTPGRSTIPKGPAMTPWDFFSGKKY